jgi:hypothetical protein
MKRPAQPEEIAPAFVFFASNTDSSYITGEVLTLLGGETTAAWSGFSYLPLCLALSSARQTPARPASARPAPPL